MKFPRWAKATAFTLSAIITGGLTKIASVTYDGEKDLQEKMQGYDGAKIIRQLADQTVDSSIRTRIRNDMDLHAGLLFYCGPKISKKISGLKSANGVELIQEQDDCFTVWQADEHRYEKWEKILAVVDPETKMQICATYDSADSDLVLHFGGTDFASLPDLANAAASAFDGVSSRSAVSADYTCKAITVFMQRHPNIKPKNVHLSYIAHSAGAASVPAAIVVATAQGFKVNTADIMAGFGGRKAFDLVAKTTGIPVEILEKNVISISAVRKGVLDHFTTAMAPVGKQEGCNAQGHLGKNFIISYNQERSAAYKR